MFPCHDDNVLNSETVNNGANMVLSWDSVYVSMALIDQGDSKYLKS